MPAVGKVRITIDDDPAIVARIDALAEAEGLSRNDIVRRAIRRLLFSLPDTSTGGFNPPIETDQPADVAA